MNLITKIYLFLINIIKIIFIKISPIIPRWLGIFLYKISLKLCIKILIFKIPEIKSIYLKTKFDSWFKPGSSDLDIIIVIQDQKGPHKEIKLFSRYLKARKLATTLFPFIDMYVFPLFMNDFKKWKAINQENIYHDDLIKDMKLIYGKDIPVQAPEKPTKLSGFGLRFSYESILVSVYNYILHDKKNIRPIYKNSLIIIRSFFIHCNKQDGSLDDYKNFLLKQGIDEEFINQFFALPKNNFRVKKEFLIQTIFNLNKIFEIIGKDYKPENINDDFEIVSSPKSEIKNIPEINEFVDKLEKRNIKSIYITQEAFENIDSYFLYLITPEKIKYEEFKNQIEEIFSKLEILKTNKEKIKIRERKTMYIFPPDIFPVIFTAGALKFSLMINYGFLFEAPNFNLNSKKLFGDDLKIIIKKIDLENSSKSVWYVNIPLSVNEYSEKILFYRAVIDKLFKKTNKFYLNNSLEEYQKIFGKLEFNFNDREKRYIYFRKNLISK